MQGRKILLTSRAAHDQGHWQTQQAAERLGDIKSHINHLRKFMLMGSDKSPNPPAREPG